MAEEQDDFLKFQEIVRGQVREALAEDQQRRQQPDPTEVQRRQLGDTVRSFVNPDIDDAKLTAADALDYAKFYTDNPLGKEYKDEVEQSFDIMKKAGRATSRSDLLKHAVGREVLDSPEKFEQRMTARKKAELDRASFAGDFPANSELRAKQDRYSTMESLVSKYNKDGHISDEELSQLEEAMGAETF